jgi:hypothetical protein
MQGKLLVVACPYDSILEPDLASTGKGLASLTSFPAATIIDLARQHTGEITIPFTSFSEYWNLQSLNDLNSIRVRFIVIAPIISGTAVATELISYTVQVQAVDADVAGPSLYSVPVTAVASQNEIPRELHIAGEPQAKSMGPVTTVLDTIATVAEYSSKIPTLEVFARPISWIFGGFAAIADHFGWSRPPNVDKANLMVNRGTHGMANAIGVDNSQVLAMSPDNQLTVPNDHYPTEHDEMSIGYLCARPSYYTSFVYGRAAVPGDVIFQDIVSPYTHLISGAPPASFSPTPMEFAARFFRNWRGDIIYTFDFTKTAMHNGKVLIGYAPNNATLTNGLLSAQHLLYTQQVDISTTSIVKFRVNYMSQAVWEYSAGSTPTTGPIGRVVVIVMNSLQHPDTVSDAVTVLVGKNSDNMQFALPVDTAPVPTTSVNPQFNLISRGPLVRDLHIETEDFDLWVSL